MKEQLINFYLEYLNDFLTIERYAEYNDMSIAMTEELIYIGRKLHQESTE